MISGFVLRLRMPDIILERVEGSTMSVIPGNLVL